MNRRSAPYIVKTKVQPRQDPGSWTFADWDALLDEIAGVAIISGVRPTWPGEFEVRLKGDTEWDVARAWSEFEAMMESRGDANLTDPFILRPGADDWQAAGVEY